MWSFLQSILLKKLNPISFIYISFSGRGFKSHSGQLSRATSNNPSMVNTIYIHIYIYILYIINYIIHITSILYILYIHIYYKYVYIYIYYIFINIYIYIYIMKCEWLKSESNYFVTCKYFQLILQSLQTVTNVN